MYDIIGDIHGYAEPLIRLLEKLGYTKSNGTWQHPDRKIIFVGDYIDRGPAIRETLQIVKGMTNSGNGIALMGNHEYNALCFHTQEREGGHLRKHLLKNIIQHYETLKQFQNRQEEYEGYLDWFKTLFLFYEQEKFRVVHSCWDKKHIKYLRRVLINDRLNDVLLYKSVKKGTRLNKAIDDTVKGKEIKMPEGLFFTDKDGTERNEIRVKWWENPKRSTYKEISVEPIEGLPEIQVDVSLLTNSDYYNKKEKPVFFGHYWLTGSPLLHRQNICCLDYSVANKGHLVAYRFDGEEMLDNAKLVYI